MLLWLNSSPDIIQAIPMTGPEAVDIARSYEEVADIIFLDSVAPGVSDIGIAGTTHDGRSTAKLWKPSRNPAF